MNPAVTDKNRFSRSASRPGAALLMTIVCLVVIASLAVSLARSLVAEHRQTRLRCDQMQAFWLAESAVQRGVVRLVATPEYTGEDWQVEVQMGGGLVRARAAIRVEVVAGDPQRRRIVVEARCPADGDASVLETRELVVTPAPAEGNP
jgi:Tfp pilus assembly protein PilX